jgi:hypothetical protein
MNYKVFDSVSYGHGEPLLPFCLVKECTTLNEVREFLEDKDDYYFICDKNNNIICDTKDTLYESPDKGKTIYKKNRLNNKIK